MQMPVARARMELGTAEQDLAPEHPIPRRPAPQMSAALSQRLRQLRSYRKLSLGQLSRLSGVSKSMLSKIELGHASPTATVLGKIAEGLGVSISHVMGGPEPSEIIVMRAQEHPVFRVPKTGFERQSLSPMTDTRGVDLALNILPAGQSSGVFPPHRAGVEEILAVAQGRVALHLGGETYELNQGDSIFYRAQQEHSFENPSNKTEARFYIVINNTRADY
jgi:XRE family transcriptional regulator, regulator of sulfur utilization